MNLTEKQLEQVSGAIITSFVNLHFLEEANNSGLFRHQTKKHVSRVLKDLIEIENKYFSEIEKVDEKDLGDKLVANKLEFVKWILNKFSFNDFTKIQEMCIAYSLDKEKIIELSDKILTENGAETVE
jgi:hypothetical protein